MNDDKSTVSSFLPGGLDDAMTVVILTAALVLLLQVVELPIAFYQGHLPEHRYRLSTQSAGHWLARC